MPTEIETERFLLRELSDQDVTERYLSWFRDPDAITNISSASSTTTLEELRRYVADRVGRTDVLFLGIFERASGEHIGNLKYEPVDSVRGHAIMGILIGEPAYRGRGVAAEVLGASGRWLKEQRDIREIVLGVGRENEAAIRSYEKVGFRVSPTPHIPAPGSGSLTMVWPL